MFRKVLGVLRVGGRDEKIGQGFSESCSSSSSDSESSWHSAEPGANELDNFHGPSTESDSEICTTFGHTPDFAALRAGLPVNYYGPNESDSAASTSSPHSRRDSRAEGHRKRHTRRSNSYSIPGIQEESLDSVVSRSRELRLDN